jgi:cell wall-associated NlpC family hydrolase
MTYNCKPDVPMFRKGPAGSWGMWWRCLTIGGVAIATFSVAAAGASTPAPHTLALHHRAATQTYMATAWPGLISQAAPASPAPSPAASPAGSLMSAPPAVVPPDPCAATPPNAGATLTAATTSEAEAGHGTTATLTGLSVGPTVNSTLGSVIPSQSGQGTTGGGGSGSTPPTGVGLPASGPSTSTTTPNSPPQPSSSSTTVPSSASPAPTPSAPQGTPSTTLPQPPVPSGGGTSTGIGCDLIGSATVGELAAGETPTEVAAVTDALGLLGVQYLWGGESTHSGFDCSGLAQYVYREAGVSLPRVAQQQFDAGPAVPPGTLVEPGDLVFFGSSANGVEHVGMYMGSGLMIDAPHTGAVVRFDRVQGFGPIVGVTAPGQR